MRQQRKRSSPLSGKRDKPSPVGQVGIFFLFGGDRVLIESTQISEAELCSGFVNHVRGHEAFWAQLQSEGRVPRDQEYLEFPRGRVVFDSISSRYLLYLDKCIIKKPAIVTEIKRRLHLPRRVEISSDPHYRCPICLSRSSL